MVVVMCDGGSLVGSREGGVGGGGKVVLVVEQTWYTARTGKRVFEGLGTRVEHGEMLISMRVAEWWWWW